MMISSDFSPLTALIGGALIGLSAVLLLGLKGRVAGVSTIVARLLPPYQDDELPGRVAFVLGLIAAPLLSGLVGYWPQPIITGNSMVLVISGLLVGFGTVWGYGCTSGHGVCGLSMLSTRSIVATGIFMATAMVTVFIVRHLAGG